LEKAVEKITVQAISVPEATGQLGALCGAPLPSYPLG